MAVIGIVLRQNDPKFDIVTPYYKLAPHEPTKKGPLPVDRVDVFANTFHSLATAILAKRRSHVVVVAHGDKDYGLVMPLASSTTVMTGSCMRTFLALVESLDDSDGKTPDPKKLQAAANDSGLKPPEVLAVAQTCWKIRWADGVALALHFRGCSIGADEEHLKRLQRLFRSTVVSAPKEPMFYARARPLEGGKGPVRSVEEYARTHAVVGRRYIYDASEAPGLGPLLLDIEKIGSDVNTQSAVENRADIHKWAVIFHENTQTLSTDTIPVAGMFPTGEKFYYLAHEPGYVDRLAAVRDS